MKISFGTAHLLTNYVLLSLEFIAQSDFQIIIYKKVSHQTNTLFERNMITAILFVVHESRAIIIFKDL